MRVVLTHGYSVTNSGDGLLVEEAAALVREAFPGAEINLVANDPESFRDQDLGRAVHPLLGDEEGSSLRQVKLGLKTLSKGRLRSDVAGLIDRADLVVAVGGGYLRSKTPLEAFKMVLTHYVQLPARQRTVPYIYLSQSIGPLRFGTLEPTRRRLGNASLVCVRDDRSLALLSSLQNVQRTPDLALLGLPDEWRPEDVAQVRPNAKVGLVARALSGSRSRVRKYDERIRDLASADGIELLAQATARGNDDPAYYRGLGFDREFRSLRAGVSKTSSDRVAVTVSVRLHGALQSVRLGVPSVHLSYERKGFGAYDDLGLSRFVHNAYDFDPEAVRAQVSELREDPTTYWDAVAHATATLRDRRQTLVDTLRGFKP
ncbi:polysaccharide pyruvyl transferase family protein [Pseudoclavibacter helvolus]|uniref:polysaccharide pyruvyl transferase family protein n=1 Tax=Pseudoclavibacter helvolus TaxID=255205 RepID=UPI003C77103B